MRTLPEAVTFDFHNTIARCDQWFQLEVYDLVPAFLRWHRERYGEPHTAITREEAIQVYRRIRGEVMQHGMEKDAETCVDLVTRELGYPLDPRHISEGLEAIMRPTLDDSVPIEGVVDAILSLRADGVRLGVVSSAVYHPFLLWSLEKFGIIDAFDAVVTSASSGYYKSHAGIYRYAVETLGSTPETTLHVGDSVRFDVESAASIGITTILYDTGDGERTDAAAAVVRTLIGIDKVIGDVYQRTPAT